MHHVILHGYGAYLVHAYTPTVVGVSCRGAVSAVYGLIWRPRFALSLTSVFFRSAELLIGLVDFPTIPSVQVSVPRATYRARKKIPMLGLTHIADTYYDVGGGQQSLAGVERCIRFFPSSVTCLMFQFRSASVSCRPNSLAV